MTSSPRTRGDGPGGKAPLRVVAIGGGTGLPAVLRGLRRFVQSGELSELTAIVAMTDDGGSSGRLRRTRGLPPPGDLRNCLVALSCDESLLAGLFQHRYRGDDDVGGHSVGNLILAALAEMTGSFMKAVEVSSLVLRTAGRILPVTLDDAVLEAEIEDGSIVVGESRIGGSGKRIRRLRLRPAGVTPTPGVVRAILDADLVSLGPGSLYTSLLPNLLVGAVSDALRATTARKIFVANLVSERGEAAGMDLRDQLSVVEATAGGRFVDAVLVHDGAIDPAILRRYQAEGASPLSWADRGPDTGAVVRRPLLAAGTKLRHDPDATAEGILEAWALARRDGATMRAGRAEPPDRP